MTLFDAKVKMNPNIYSKVRASKSSIRIKHVFFFKDSIEIIKRMYVTSIHTYLYIIEKKIVGNQTILDSAQWILIAPCYTNGVLCIHKYNVYEGLAR